MKKGLFVILDLLTIAALIGGYVVQYFTKRKLGMTRWVNFHVARLKEVLPVALLRYLVLALLLLLTLWILRSGVRKLGKLGPVNLLMLAVLAALNGARLWFTFFVTEDHMRCYYLVLPLIFAAVLLQVIRSGIAVGTCRNEE